MKYWRATYAQYSRIADEWIASKPGLLTRLGIMGGVSVLYPIGMLLWNGPLVNKSFRWREDVDYVLPKHLSDDIAKQYNHWLDRVNKLPKNVKITFSCQNQPGNFDTIARGSLAVRSGVQVALPFYARFQTEEEATEYCRNNLEPLTFLGKTLCVLWESKAGKELISTFIMSKNALAFLINRDMSANEGYTALTEESLTYFCGITFASAFTHWFYQRVLGGTAMSFVVTYTILLALALFAIRQWHYGYVYLNELHADDASARLSNDNCQGGREYYLLMLKRNRILRDLIEKEGDAVITSTGDIRSQITPLFMRYDCIKDIFTENQEIRPALEGDD